MSNAEDPDVVSPFYHVCHDERVLVGPLGRRSVAEAAQETYERRGYETDLWISEYPVAYYCRICDFHLRESAVHAMYDASTDEMIAIYCEGCAELEQPEHATGRLSGYRTTCPTCGVENPVHRSEKIVNCEECHTAFDPAKHWKSPH